MRLLSRRHWLMTGGVPQAGAAGPHQAEHKGPGERTRVRWLAAQPSCAFVEVTVGVLVFL